MTKEQVDLELYDVSKRQRLPRRERGHSIDIMSSSLGQNDYGKDFTMQDISETGTQLIARKAAPLRQAATAIDN